MAAAILFLTSKSGLGASSLSPNETLEGRCSARGVPHRFSLVTGEYFRAWLEPHGDVAATIFNPAGRVMVAAALGPDAVAPLSFVADRTGTYTLEVDCEPNQADANYRLRLEPRRAASAKDIETLVAERAFLAAEKVARGWQEPSRQTATEAFQRVLASSREIGERLLEARVLVRLGELHLTLGDAQRALQCYQQALSLEQGTPVQVDAHLGAAFAYLRLDEREKALPHVKKALTLSNGVADERRRASSLTTLGVVHYFFEEFQQAVESLQTALVIWQKLKDGRNESEALMHLGFAYSDLSDEQRALECHGLALELAQQVGDKRLQALILTAIGNVYSKMGEKQQALNFYYQATPLLEAMGDPYWTVSLYSGIGYIYVQLGDEQNALAYYARAVEINRKISSTLDEGANLVHLGRTHMSMGNAEEALACYQTALEIFRKLDLVRMEAVALGDIATAHEALGHEAEAIDYYARALELYRISQFKREEANTLNNVGRIEERRGHVDTAVRHYRRALALSRETQDRFVESQSLLNLARIARASGDLDQAQQRAEEALRLVERLRGSVASYSLRASYFASVHELHEFYVDLLMELDGERPSKAFDVLAFQASEKARARSLLEMLYEDPPDETTLDPKLFEQQTQLERELRSRAGTWERSSGRTAQDNSDTDSSAELSELLGELDRVQAVIRSQSDHDPPLEFAPASIEELQKELDSSTLLLSYFLGSERSYLWVVSRSSLSVYPLPPRNQIEARVQDLYRLLTARDRREDETAKQFYERARETDREYWESALPLSRTLLGPVAGELEAKRLVIVGDGALHHFPFSALPIPPRPGDTVPHPLIAEHEIVRLPSASILVALRTRDLARAEPPKAVAILADPVFDRADARVEGRLGEKEDPGAPLAALLPVSRSAGDLTRALKDVRLGEGEAVPRLLASRQEANSILSLVPPGEGLAALGFDASRALATSEKLSQYRVVHFATHGILNTEHPELSGIILSLIDESGQPQDGFLRLHDIETLHLPVNLVVLSACSTGLGKEVKGEGMIGLVRGFMSAGADRVLASYWNVDDEATAELMERFYRSLFTTGLAPSAALREAQRSMRTEKRWSSPFYWAAFELQGQWQ